MECATSVALFDAAASRSNSDAERELFAGEAARAT
jgi:hypothetical protein